MPQEGASQHTPSVQKPDAHSPLLLHASPFERWSTSDEEAAAIPTVFVEGLNPPPVTTAWPEPRSVAVWKSRGSSIVDASVKLVVF